MKFYHVVFKVVRSGDPEAPDGDCTTALVDGLSWGETPGEAWQKILDYCEAKWRKSYGDSRKRAVESMMARYTATGGASAQPQILQWGMLVPYGDEPEKICEVGNAAGKYHIEVPLWG